MDIRRLVKPNIRSLRAYQAVEVPCRVKLDANESPYSAASGQRSAFSLKKNLQTLNRYPDPEAKALRNLVAKQYKVKAVNILHGNGSDELIYYLINTFGGPVLFPTPTFSMYGIISQSLGEKGIGIPLNRNFNLDTKDMLKAVKGKKPKLVFLSSPNNPTGNAFSSDRIEKIIRQSKGLVVVDEAYQAFSSKKSFVPLLKKYKNLIILKTLSKVGLAALRVGFMIAHEDVVNEVNKVRLPFNLNTLSQELAVDTLKRGKLSVSTIKTIISERKRLIREMKKVNGIVPYPSDANFILFKAADSDALYRMFLKEGILIRNMKGAVGGCLRVTVGRPKENTVFLETLRNLL